MSKPTTYCRPLVDTPLLIENLSAGRDVHLSWEAEQAILWRLVNTRCCELCLARFGQMCRVYGGVSTLRRTHAIRVRMTTGERRVVVNAALDEVERRRALHQPDAEWVA